MLVLGFILLFSYSFILLFFQKEREFTKAERTKKSLSICYTFAQSFHKKMRIKLLKIK